MCKLKVWVIVILKEDQDLRHLTPLRHAVTDELLGSMEMQDYALKC